MECDHCHEINCSTLIPIKVKWGIDQRTTKHICVKCFKELLEDGWL